MSSREKLIGVILISVLCVWSRIYFPKFFKRPPSATRHGSAAKTDKPEAKNNNISIDDLLSRWEAKKTSASAKVPGNPFQKFEPVRKVKEGNGEYSDLTLTGIVWEADEPAALINDDIFHAGDTIAGFTVEEIRKDAVVISRGLEKHTLQLFVPLGDKD